MTLAGSLSGSLPPVSYRPDMTPSVQAVAVLQFGEPPSVMEVPAPMPGPGELLVRMTAVGMNPYDAKILDGILRPRPHVFPLIAGVDGAGVVTSVGEGVRRFRAGDRVFGQFLHDPVGTGTYAELAPVPERIGVARVPAEVTDAEAAAIPTAGMTARDALDRLALRPGATLLVVGASGGIGSFAVPFAVAEGVHVIAAARPRSFDRLRALGAGETVDVSAPDWEEGLLRGHPGGVDGLLDLMSDRERFARRISLLRIGGRAATTVYAADPEHPPSHSVEAFNIDLQPSAPLLERTVGTIQRHRTPVSIERSIGLAEAPAALVEIRAGRAVGKSIIRFPE